MAQDNWCNIQYKVTAIPRYDAGPGGTAPTGGTLNYLSAPYRGGGLIKSKNQKLESTFQIGPVI